MTKMTMTPVNESTQPRDAKSASRVGHGSSSAAAVSQRVLGIEIEAAEARCVPVVDGCVADPVAGAMKVPAPVIAARQAPPDVGAAPRTNVPNTPAGKSRMVYQRPVNPKLVSARPAAASVAAPGTGAPKEEPKSSGASSQPAAAANTPATPSSLPRIITPPDESIAPSAILPRFAGEPLRADLRWPPQARGTGEVWPPEARIEAGQMAGRFPLAYAWHLLGAQQPWTWSIEGRAVELSAAQAIAQAIHSMARLPRGQAESKSTDSHAASSNGKRLDACTVVMPDHLPVAAQQALLDAAHAQQLNLSLLPRPIAAAMAWCDRHASELDADRAEPDRPVGSILVLHMGLDMWEVTTVDIIPRRIGGEMRFIPARRRNPIAPLPSFGIELMHRLAIRSLEMSYQQMSAARVWELIWCTPWLKAAISMLSDGDVAFPSVVALAKHARSGEFLKQQCRQATQRIFRAVEPVAGLLRQCLGKTPQFTDIRDWFAQRKLEAPTEGYLGAIITGPMANMPLDKDSVGQHHLLKIWPKPVRVMIEGVTTPTGVLAASAGWHGDFLRKKEQGDEDALVPTYLEKLPRVRIAATVQGQPAWVDLLDEMPGYVAGGLAVARPRPLTGFPIKPDTTRFKIAIDHEDWPTVHIAAAPLPQVLSEPQPVELHASLRGSHGYPEIELVPVREGLFGRQRVLIDMRTMKDTGKKADEFLRGYATT